MNDNKLVGTVSVFQGVRRNEKLDDSFRQSNDEEPYNRSTDLFSPGTRVSSAGERLVPRTQSPGRNSSSFTRRFQTTRL
jgi:hypothetical protein